MLNTQLYTAAACPSGEPSAAELATVDPSPAEGVRAIGEYTLPDRAEVEVFEDPTFRPGRECSVRIPSEIGEAVLDRRRIALVDLGTGETTAAKQLANLSGPEELQER